MVFDHYISIRSMDVLVLELLGWFVYNNAENHWKTTVKKLFMNNVIALQTRLMRNLDTRVWEIWETGNQRIAWYLFSCDIIYLLYAI